MTLSTQDQDSNQDDSFINDETNEGTSAEATTARELQVINAINALDEAEVQIYNLRAAVHNIRSMLPATYKTTEKEQNANVEFVPFSHVGKEIRNKLMADLYTNLEAVEDSIKASWRSVKNVKRTRLSEDQIDKLIINQRDANY